MPLCRSPLTLRLALFSRSRTAAVEIPRFILHRRRSEFLPLHRGAEKCAQFALHRGAKKRAQFALQRTGSRGRSRAAHRFAAVALPLQDVPRPAAHLNILPKGRNISHAQSAYFTAPQARFHTAAKLPYITAARRDAHSLLQPFGTKKSL